MVTIDRNRGMLSKSDREYALKYEEWVEDKSRPAANQREKAIVDRLYNSMFDFQHLADEKFPEELLESVFFKSLEQTDSENGKGKSKEREGLASFIKDKDPKIEESCIAAVSLIYRIYKRGDANVIIEKGVTRAVQDFYRDKVVVDASYNPELESPEAAYHTALEKLELGEPMSSDQIKLLLERGEVDPEKIAEHVRKGLTREPREQNMGFDRGSYNRSRGNSAKRFPIDDRYSVDMMAQMTEEEGDE